MISISVKALFYEQGGGLGVLPLLAVDQMLSRSLSWSDVSFLDFFFVCLSPPTFVSHHNAFFSLELASISQSTQTCFLSQLIQMPTQCFMYISCPITEPSIFNGDKILVPININPTLFVLFVFHSAVHYPSLTLSFCNSLWFMPSSFFFLLLSFFSSAVRPSHLHARPPNLPNNVCAYACQWQEMPIPLISFSVNLLWTSLCDFIYIKSYLHLSINLKVWLWC